MDFLDPKKKQAHLTRLFIGYLLVAIAIAFASLILLFQSYGYDLDRKTGKVIQNGLIFVSSHPDAATMYLNGTLNKYHTDAKLTIPAAQYTIDIKKAGYRTWRRSLTLEGGSIERLIYPLLIPDSLKTTDVQLYGAPPKFVTQSPDHRWLIVQKTDSLTVFDVYDLTNISQEPATITLPTDVFTTSTGDVLTSGDWSSDNRHFLLKHSFAGGLEFILVDREIPAQTVNESRAVGSSPTHMTLRDGHADQLYVLAQDRTLSQYDTKSKQSKVILTAVDRYVSGGADIIIYSQSGITAPENTRVYEWDGSTSYLLRTLPAGSAPQMTMGQLDGDTFVALAPGNDPHVYIYKNPLNDAKQQKNTVLVPTTILKQDQTGLLSNSSNGRFVVSQTGNAFAVYDAEADRRFYFTIKSAITAGAVAHWMDGFRMSVESNGKIVIFDFDGSNQQTMTASNSGFSPFFDKDTTVMYNLAPSVVVPGRSALTSTSLRVK